jgi:hypothetical protein
MNDETLIHRIGPNTIENFELNAREKRIPPFGISVLIGGSPEQAAKDMITAINSKRMRELTKSVSTASLKQIRSVGFDVVSSPTPNFPNHGTLLHSQGSAGFAYDHLESLVDVFQVWEDV